MDAVVAQSWGRRVARALALGRIEPMDAFIAATADAADPMLVARDVKRFIAEGTRLHNPWTD